MKRSLIEQIYLDRKEIEPSEQYKVAADQAYELYSRLCGMLNDTQVKMFDDYANLRTDECAETEIAHFREGVKFGFLFCMECLR